MNMIADMNSGCRGSRALWDFWGTGGRWSFSEPVGFFLADVFLKAEFHSGKNWKKNKG